MPKSDMSRSPWDRNFATNFKTLREDMGLTQEDVVAKMAHFGFTFHQATVYKIEKGERKVGLGEAIALAECLDTSIDALTSDGILATGNYYQSTLWQLMDNMFLKLRQIWDLTDEYNEQRSKLLAVMSRFLDETDVGREIDRVFPDDADQWWQNVRTEYAPTLACQVVNQIRQALIQATDGELNYPFTNITGYAEFSQQTMQPADPIIAGLDADLKKVLERWGA
jgi:transcriptional regulator with XRE-family HTH domain